MLVWCIWNIYLKLQNILHLLFSCFFLGSYIRNKTFMLCNMDKRRSNLDRFCLTMNQYVEKIIGVCLWLLCLFVTQAVQSEAEMLVMGLIQLLSHFLPPEMFRPSLETSSLCQRDSVKGQADRNTGRQRKGFLWSDSRDSDLTHSVLSMLYLDIYSKILQNQTHHTSVCLLCMACKMKERGGGVRCQLNKQSYICQHTTNMATNKTVCLRSPPTRLSRDELEMSFWHCLFMAAFTHKSLCAPWK